MEGIKRSMTQVSYYFKRSFRVPSTNGKLDVINVLNDTGTVFNINWLIDFSGVSINLGLFYANIHSYTHTYMPAGQV